MDPFEPQLILKKEVRFSESLVEANQNPEENFGDVFGGIIKSGQWGWLTKGSRLCITSLRTGQLISKFEFDDSNGFGMCIITCVSEIQLPYLTDTIVAVGIQYADCPGGLAVIYSVEESTVIRCIELKHKITCCKFISQEVSQHTVLQNMNGCLAIGTDSGSVLLVDLNLRGDEMNASVVESGVSIVPCHVVDYSMSVLHLHRHFQHCQQEGVHFGIQLEVLDNAKFIQSLLPIDLILSLAVGLADGRLVLYDLTDMQVFYVAPPQERSSPLVKMNFMEPPDDPRSCVYIWAFHENYQNSMAVMHSLMYEKRVVAEDGFCYFENFQVSCVRLMLPLNCAKSVPIACQAITKAPSHGNEETISLCALVWKQDQEAQTEVLLFDINQWYKEEMPYVGDWREDPSYLASFVFKGLSSLEMYFNPNTISLFNSIQRPEEHFYPVSLSFDAVALGENSCVHLNWPGAQNRVINVLRSKGSLALLDPNPIFREILNTRLLPQFSGMNYKSTFSLKAKRETLLSVAIEQNCIGLLKECARNWSDGSHQGKSIVEGLSMSTLTDWLWARASSIKERCNTLGQVLFNHSGCTLDQREQKELGYISKQLKTLADLLSEIVDKYGDTIPSDVLATLESQGKSIRMASDYQEILLWLLNIGLLPEGSRSTRHREDELNLVPYPYESLRRFYEERRVEFTRPYEKYAPRKTRSCHLLFIDSFIEHEFQGNSLRDSWQESGGDGLYPPTSIQAMLRVMLIPEVTFENKCALFLYFFLDLNMEIEDKQYEPIVQNFIKFPSVFRLSASLIKQIQAFWNLDHCRFQAAVDEFISPFNKDQVCPQWQLELFLESLLAQNEANLALRVLEAKPSPTSPVLQLNTYLSNDLISEAFHFARSKQDEDLLKLFFSRCLSTGKFGVIRDLALTESEGNLVQSLLKNSKSRNAENLHFVYLLQKYKYIEAVSYLDELSKGRVIQRAVDVDTPTLVLSAYNTTMTPVTKGLSDVYFKIKNKIKSKETERSSPYPLSCQLIKQNANDLLGGIYHSSALSAHFASHYWERHQSTEGNTLQQSTNAPFLRRPQVASSYSEFDQKESISYPDPYKAAQKRRLDNNSSAEEERVLSKIRENPKKRRKVYDPSDLDSIYRPLSKEQPTADNLLTHFRNVPTHSLDITNLTRKWQKTPPKERAFFLETPYVKNTVVDGSANVTTTRVPEKPATSLQGILKVSNTKSSTDESHGKRSASVETEKKERKDVEEEKSIRFILPTVEDESEENDEVEQDIQMESDDGEEKIQENLSQPLRRFAGPAKRKSLRSVSTYMPLAREVESKLLFKKAENQLAAQKPPPKLSSLIEDKKENEEMDKEQSSNMSGRSMGIAGRKLALITTRTKDLEEKPKKVSIEILENIIIPTITVTEPNSTIEEGCTECSEDEEPTSSSDALSRPSLWETKTESTLPTLEKFRSDDSEKQPTSRISPRRGVSSRLPLRSEKNMETKYTSSVVRDIVAEPIMFYKSDKSIEPKPQVSSDTQNIVTEPRRVRTSEYKASSVGRDMAKESRPFFRKEKTIETERPASSIIRNIETEPRLSLRSGRTIEIKDESVKPVGVDIKTRSILESDRTEYPASSADHSIVTEPRPFLSIERTNESKNQLTSFDQDTVTASGPYLRSDRTMETEHAPSSVGQNIITKPRSTLISVKSTETEPPVSPVDRNIVTEPRSSLLNKTTLENERPISTIVHNIVIESTPSLRSETATEISQASTEPKWFLDELRAGKKEEQSAHVGIDTVDKVNNIPVILVDENYYPEAQPESELEPENITLKTSKRALSESSDERTSESTHFAQHRAKQLKGRDSIHSSLTDITEQKSPTSSEPVISPKSNLQPMLNIHKTDTMIDFHPPVSSSTKVCATESKFNTESTESVKISETESKFHSEKVTSKITFSERSTVVGGLSYMPTMETTENVTDTISVTIQPRDRMLDTTVDMTLYDTMGFESSHHKPAEESSNSQSTFSDNKYQEEDSLISEFNEQASEENNEVDDDSGSVILLSSRSSSSHNLYDDGTDNSDNRTQETTARQIVIGDDDDDEEEDDDSEGIDVLDSDGSEECNNSFSNQFDEAVSVTRTSTSCSIKTNNDTVLSSDAENEAETFGLPVREVEEGEKYSEGTSNETDKVNPIADDESLSIMSDASVYKNQEETSATSEGCFSEFRKKSCDDDKETGKSEAKRAKINEDGDPAEASVDENAQSVSTTVDEKIGEENTKKIEENISEGAEAENANDNLDKSTGTIVKDKEESNENLANDKPLKDSSAESRTEEMEEHTSPDPPRRRSKSFSKTLIADTDVTASPSSRRNSRSGSVPPASGSQIVTRRRSNLLESLNENVMPDSPSTRTRSKLRADSIDADIDSPSVSSIKRSRLSSISSVTSIEQPNTPKGRRRSTVSVDKDLGSTPKTVGTPRATRARSITSEVATTPIKTPRRLSTTKKNDSPTDESSVVGTPRATRARSITSEVTTTPIRTPRRLSVTKRNDSPTDQTSLVSTSKGHTKEEENITEIPETEPETSQADDYKSSRRLTRTQLAVLEKSAALSAQIAASPVRVTRRRASRSSEKTSPPTAGAKENDNESISSEVSHLSNSSRRITRSAALKEHTEDDIISIASSTESGRRRRKRIKESTSPNATLSAIPEEEPNGSEGSVSNSQTSKRSRRQKQ